MSMSVVFVADNFFFVILIFLINLIINGNELRKVTFPHV